jgi:large subunit ribosomal protein L6
MAKTFLKPIDIPSEVSLSCKDKSILAKGKLGELVLNVHSDVELLIDDEKISFTPSNELPQTLALTGTMRALTKNIIEGVSVGFEKKLEINGVGYRAKLSGNKLELSLGFSHPVVYELPEAVSAEVPSQTEIVLKSADKQKIGQVAAEIRSFRPPEPYKGKGVRYSNERIRRKESKKA